MMDKGIVQLMGVGAWRRTGQQCLRVCKLVYAVLVLFLLPVHSYQPKKMFLNSYAQCGHGDSKDPWYKVDKTSLYNVRDDARPDAGTHAFRNCEMVFRSTRSDGHLCVFQRKASFDNHRVAIKLYDGGKDMDGLSEPNKTLNVDDQLDSAEWCTSGRMLTIEMAQAGSNPSVREVDVDLLVYDLQSIHRKAFMDSSPSCGSNFIMEGSQVNVTNIDPNRKEGHIFPQCVMSFEYKGQEKNRTMCMVFKARPEYNPDCKVNYTLKVFEHRLNEATNRLERVYVNKRTCKNPFPWRWCYNSTKISLQLYRPLEPVVLESSVVFHALVLDHAGGPESLPLVFKESTAPDPSVQLIVPIVLGCVGFVCLCLIIICVVLRLRDRRQKPRPSNDNGAAETMLDGNDGQHSRSNGQNHYTAGTTGTTPAFV